MGEQTVGRAGIFFSFPLPVLVGTAADWHKEAEREGGRRRKVRKSLISRTKADFLTRLNSPT